MCGDAPQHVHTNRLRPAVWRGELVALAGIEQSYVIAPWLLSDDAPLDAVAYVALLCLFHREVLNGAFPSDVDPAARSAGRTRCSSCASSPSERTIVRRGARSSRFDRKLTHQSSSQLEELTSARSHPPHLGCQIVD